MNRPVFLRVCLINSLFACALVAGGLAYPHVHPVALAAIIVVLAAYAAGAAGCAYVAWYLDKWEEEPPRILDDVAELAERLPGVALLGTAAGFLIALSGDAADVQQRISGAATGIVSTFIGVAAWLALSLQHRLVSRGAS